MTTQQQADHRGLWDDKPYEEWTYHTPHTRPTWDSEKMAIYYKVSGAMKQARFHGGRWQYQKDASTWKNCGMKRNLIMRTYKMQQQVVQNTIVVEGGEEDSHRCNICLEDVQFPMSNGCCSFKFCKDCYEQMPREQKRICSGCRAPTPFTLSGGDTYNGRNIREWAAMAELYTEMVPRFTDAVQRAGAAERSLQAAEERITEYQTNLMSANTRNEELLEQNEKYEIDVQYYKELLDMTMKEKEMHEARIDELLCAEKNATKYQMMYNKVIRMSIMLMVMLLFSVLR